jgi:hypothetical protein
MKLPTLLYRRPIFMLLALAGAAASQAGVTRPAMRERVDRDIADLVAVAQAPAAVDTATLATLPAPVQRYLAYTGADRAPAARFTRFRFEGEVRLPLTGGARGVTSATPWMPTRGEQYMALSTQGLGYVWDSVWQQGPDTRIDVRDLYAKGDTHIWAVRSDGRVMVDERHDDINRTYMIRFFAEATQSPTMLLPGRHLRWEAVDDRRARAHVKDGALSASMLCSFEADGALTRCESDDRLLRFSGDVPQRWVGARWVMTRSDYRPFGALRVPTTMSVSWLMPEGEFEQVRAKTIEVDFDVATPYPAKEASTAARQPSR